MLEYHIWGNDGATRCCDRVGVVRVRACTLMMFWLRVSPGDAGGKER
jgi:hypothetical protein